MNRFNSAVQASEAEVATDAGGLGNNDGQDRESGISVLHSLPISSGNSKRRGEAAAEHGEFLEAEASNELAQGSKRHRMETSEAQAMQPFAAQPLGIDGPETYVGHMDSSDDDDNEEEEEEELNIDGSYAPSPLNGIEAEAVAYYRYSLEEMEIVRREAYALGFGAFLQKYIVDMDVSVRSLLEVFSAQPVTGFAISDLQSLQLLKYHLARFYRNRPKLSTVNSIEDVVRLLQQSKRIMVLTGAGVSVSCGIPDFRSPTGIYTRLYDEFGLDDPQQMFDIEYFRETPELFYSFAKELYPYNFTPAPSHAFIKLLEDRNKLLRNYTQNIDTLEHVQGITSVLNCHGSFATATCIKCGYKCDGKELESDIMAKRIAYCPICNDAPRELASNNPASAETHVNSGISHIYNSADNSDDDDDDGNDADYGAIQGIMKPDITFFGEKLPDKFDEALLVDRENVDLLLVMGSSLKVAPVSDIMSHLPHTVPQIVINKTPILHFNFDVQLLGDADDIVAYLARACGWTLCHSRIPGGSTDSSEYAQLAPSPMPTPEPISIPVRIAAADIVDGETIGEKLYSVPSHWHPFSTAVITGKDLFIASGDDKVRLSVDSSDEEECETESETDDDQSGAESEDGNTDNGNAEPSLEYKKCERAGSGSDGSEVLTRDIGKATV
ncbi:NAD-dependent histone deacetylase sir2 [Coemansia sp. RSA 2320]|nr:NAD-dependent histone deacetylase sir2 [Coemansia sp. RSA 2320]